MIVSYELLKNWKQIQPMFRIFVPVHIDSNFASRDITYVGFCELFDEIEQGEESPMYDFVFETLPMGGIMTTAKRQK